MHTDPATSHAYPPTPGLDDRLAQLGEELSRIRSATALPAAQPAPAVPAPTPALATAPAPTTDDLAAAVEALGRLADTLAGAEEHVRTAHTALRAHLGTLTTAQAEPQADAAEDGPADDPGAADELADAETVPEAHADTETRIRVGPLEDVGALARLETALETLDGGRLVALEDADAVVTVQADEPWAAAQALARALPGGHAEVLSA